MMRANRERRGVSAAPKDRRRRNRPGNRKSRGTPALTITSGCFAGLSIRLRKERTLLGRAIACDICLDHSFVSDEHAVIVKTAAGYVLEDFNSRHGTSVNGVEVQRRLLAGGDRIGIGGFELRFNC